jgi:benzoate-CoA ligase family protein
VQDAMSFSTPERFNIADYFLDRRIDEGKGERAAIRTDDSVVTYTEVLAMANRFGNLLRDLGVRPEERVIIALPDSPEFVGALFGTLKIGAVVVMVNPQLHAEAIEYFYAYTRARAVIVDKENLAAFAAASEAAGKDGATIVTIGEPAFDARLASCAPQLDNFPTHRDDAAIWLFSGGTTGKPKAVVQTHNSFANTTECYAKQVIRYVETDITLSVPKLFFGYATGSNLLFPFAAGASTVLFPERCTAETLFEKIALHRPTILINVPTMINHLVSHPSADSHDLSCLRLSTSAGEALPVELHERWTATFGTELLDGLGTAEMWHVFLSNSPGAVRPGTLGTVVPGFDVRVRDDAGNDLPDDEIGWLWVRGNSRALGYWQQAEKTAEAFRGEWYVSGDMVRRDADGYFTYCGRGDDMLKVSGKWLAPSEVENCLLGHHAVAEAAVVGVVNEEGLTKPRAFVLLHTEARGEIEDVDAAEALAEELKAWVRDHLEPYKYPREVSFLDDFPRTHLGKVDRGALKSGPSA